MKKGLVVLSLLFASMLILSSVALASAVFFADAQNVVIQNIQTGQMGIWKINSSGAKLGWTGIANPSSSGWIVRAIEGNRILIQRGDGGVAGIWTINASGDAIRWLVINYTFSSNGNWIVRDMEGNKILIQSGNNGAAGIWTINANGNIVNWTPVYSPANNPGWIIRAMDGNKVLLQKGNEGLAGIWTINDAGEVLSWKMIYNPNDPEVNAPGWNMIDINNNAVILQHRDVKSKAIYWLGKDLTPSEFVRIDDDSSNWAMRAFSIPAAPKPYIVIPSECEYGQSCSSFNIDSNALGTLNYLFEFEYHYKNTSVIKEYQTTNALTNAVYSFPYTLQKRGVDYIVFRAAAKSQKQLSEWTSGRIVSAKYACTDNCSNLGEKDCIDIYNIRTCGYYNADACLEWSAPSSCTSTVQVCLNGACSFPSGIDTCTPAATYGLCLPDLTETLSKYNVQSIAGRTCPVADYSCYKCIANYSWNTDFKKCLKANCTNTCSAAGGICNASALVIAGMLANSTLECCGLDSCFVCPEGQHNYNGHCINNSCNGTKPSTEIGTIVGPNITASGLNAWAYSSSATTATGCLWKCISGYHFETRDNFTGCVIGSEPCTATPGCNNATSLANAIVVDGSCVSGSCFSCNSSYVWNGSACTTCESGKFWNGFACVTQGSCSGCIQHSRNDACLSEGLRDTLSDSSEKVYCSYDHTLKLQKAKNQTCIEDYECRSNLCGNGRCISIADELTAQRGLLEKIWCGIKDVIPMLGEPCP